MQVYVPCVPSLCVPRSMRTADDRAANTHNTKIGFMIRALYEKKAALSTVSPDSAGYYARESIPQK